MTTCSLKSSILPPICILQWLHLAGCYTSLRQRGLCPHTIHKLWRCVAGRLRSWPHAGQRRAGSRGLYSYHNPQTWSNHFKQAGCFKLAFQRNKLMVFHLRVNKTYTLPSPLIFIKQQNIYTANVPFHCRHAQYLWLQDLPPTVEHLLDPWERPP